MHRLIVDPGWDADAWRTQARIALRAGVAPEDIEWSPGTVASLFGATPLPADGVGVPRISIPAAFIPMAAQLVMHRAPRRHALPYRIAWRLTHGEPELLRRATDPDMHRAETMQREIRRDLHKMKAFVRFREVPGESDTFIAWFEPENDIVDAAAPFFARRFAGMRWSILTPYRSVHWDRSALHFGEGASSADAAGDDALEGLWRRYYAHIFNPARLNVRMMRKEMPQKYWKNLPEAHLIPELVLNAGARSQAMVERQSQAPNRRTRAVQVATTAVPEVGSLPALREAAEQCRNCELWQPATQMVFGEGPVNARVLVVGEQPGDEEDLRGRPFVGPSGKLFDKAVESLDLDRGSMYVTNAVKHFRFEQRGKFRLHRNPAAAHVRACHGWLEGELDRIKPDVIVCLGAIAAKAVFGNDFGLMQQRGQWLALANGARGFATVHPSWVLRQRDEAAREQAYRGFVEDLSLLREQRGL